MAAPSLPLSRLVPARLALAAFAPASLLVGCASPTTDGPDAEAIAQSATAVVIVERTERSNGPGDSVRGDDIVARFIRVRRGTVDDQVLRVTGVAQDVPSVGTCSSSPRDELGPAFAFSPSRINESVELLDVGPVTFGPLGSLGLVGDGARTEGTTSLLPRAMPDPTGLVSGVVYSAHASDSFSAGSTLELHASGGADLASGFTVSLSAPADLADVRATRSSAGLDVRWEAAEDLASDVVYVEVMTPSQAVLARCATLDGLENGRLLVPNAALEGLDEGFVAVHRLHRESAHTREIPLVDVRFDTARILPFRR